MPDLILFNCIAANSMQSNAAIMVGDNSASGWDTCNKNQQSVGMVFGAANVFPANFNILNDNDIIDTPIVDCDFQNTPTVQA